MDESQHLIEQRPSGPAQPDWEAPEDSAVEQARPYAYYGFLIALYNGLFAAFLLWYRRKDEKLERVTPFDLTMLGLSTLRVAKLISEDEITTVLRRPVVEVEGGKRQPRGRGLRWAIGKLVLCPTCSGTWIAALLTYTLHLFPRYARPFLAIMSASAIEQSSDALLSLVYTDRDLLRDEETVLKQT